MPTYNLAFTCNPVETAALNLLLADVNAPAVAENARRAALNPPGTPLPLLTLDQYLAARMKDLFAGYATSYQDRLLGAALTKYQGATGTVRQSVLTTLGLSSFGALPLADQLAALQAMAQARFKALSPADQAAVFSALGM